MMSNFGLLTLGLLTSPTQSLRVPRRSVTLLQLGLAAKDTDQRSTSGIRKVKIDCFVWQRAKIPFARKQDCFRGKPLIPPLNISGVLPPFIGADPAQRYGNSPYLTTMTELVNRFGTSPERINIVHGLLNYRQRLAGAGITNGLQWIDGSFVEDVETIRGRPPKDVDIVTLAYRNTPDPMAWALFVNDVRNRDIFQPGIAKFMYACDAYYIDLQILPHLVVSNAVYLMSLFSHQRSTNLWKGMLLVPLASDDAAARALI